MRWWKRRGRPIARARPGASFGVNTGMARYENIVETIGRTPVVRLKALAPPGVELYVKLESRNPGGSVKDRLAVGVIEAAERAAC